MKFALIAAAAAITMKAQVKDLPTNASDAWAACNKNGDTVLTYDEVKGCLTHAVETGDMTPKEARTAGDFVVSHAYMTQQEYLAGAEQLGFTEAQAAGAWHKFDTNDDGKLSYAEVSNNLWPVLRANPLTKGISKEDLEHDLESHAQIGANGFKTAFDEWAKNWAASH